MFDYNLGDVLPVLDFGHVILLDKMGNDQDIANAARVSYDYRGRKEDRGLLRYLMRHKHTSPFEMAVMKFEIKAPIFVARQWVRHRMASWNEVSARYTELPPEMFLPADLAKQATNNKQGRDESFSDEERDYFLGRMEEQTNHAYGTYQNLLEAGVARELARGVLPLNTYTKFIWKIDLHNLMHFLHLRLDSHAQQEIREYAEVVQRLVNLYFPLTFEAFVDYKREAYTCSRMEMGVLRELLTACVDLHDGEPIGVELIGKSFGMTAREINEFMEAFDVK